MQKESFSKNVIWYCYDRTYHHYPNIQPSICCHGTTQNKYMVAILNLAVSRPYSLLFSKSRVSFLKHYVTFKFIL